MNLLLAIKPEYAEMIFAGTKTLELRRKNPRVIKEELKPPKKLRGRALDAWYKEHRWIGLEKECESIDEVYLYATAPVGMVVGKFQCAECWWEPKENLWYWNANKTGVTEAWFDEYFAAQNVAHAMRVAVVDGAPQVTRFTPPRPVSDFGTDTPPTSFFHLDGERLYVYEEDE